MKKPGISINPDIELNTEPNPLGLPSGNSVSPLLFSSLALSYSLVPCAVSQTLNVVESAWHATTKTKHTNDETALRNH